MPTTKQSAVRERVVIESVPVSTTWLVPPGTVASRTPVPDKERAAKRRHPRSLARRNPRQPLLTYLKWRGGSMPWVEVQTRGITVRVPGYTNVAELVLLLNNCQ